MGATAGGLDGKVLIPDLLRRLPQARPVLDRYGLRGCGGRLGPYESLAFFAKAHDVPLPRLLEEIGAAARNSLPVLDVGQPAARTADAIYRPFFKAGIAVVLTLGATWGAFLLARIGLERGFAAAGLHEVNAHGHAQIFGWVGLFVMGFAYQAFPRFKHTELAHPRWAWASGFLMVGGLVTRAVSEPLTATWPELFWVVAGASVLEVAAVTVFAWLVVATWRRSGKPLAVYDAYIACALFWFLAQTVYDGVYTAATLSVTGADLVALVATWQAPLRDLQIHGFALLMILGVSQRIFPYFYGFRVPDPRLSRRVLVVLNAAVVGEAVGLVFMQLGGPAWAALWYASVLVLAGATARLVLHWRIFATPEDPDRSLKFLRTAYGWLFVSLAMLALLPAYQYVLLPLAASDSPAAVTGFSHAYYGATRHAITVGFVSLMIVGVAAKVVPTLGGVDVRSLPGLWLPFVLLNAGCALRVLGQTATDFIGEAFPIAGVSGMFEVTALAVWGAHLWRVMAMKPAAADVKPCCPQCGTAGPGAAFGSDHVVGDVLDRHPDLLPTFLAFGFTPLANPLLRRTLAHGVTLGKACRLLGIDAQTFLDALNAERDRRTDRRVALPVLEASMQTHP